MYELHVTTVFMIVDLRRCLAHSPTGLDLKVHIATVINAKQTGGLAAQKSMCESVQLSPEPTEMKAECWTGC